MRLRRSDPSTNSITMKVRAAPLISAVPASNRVTRAKWLRLASTLISPLSRSGPVSSAVSVRKSLTATVRPSETSVAS
jgi:hypothetical protein